LFDSGIFAFEFIELPGIFEPGLDITNCDLQFSNSSSIASETLTPSEVVPNRPLESERLDAAPAVWHNQRITFSAARGIDR
jgi:hypothetical protein